MKIGIIGPADRAVAWEKHLRPHQSVTEVTIAATHKGIGEVDACFLLDESEDRLSRLLETVKAGYHTYLVSPLPVDPVGVERVYHAAEESNVMLQFSHWPTMAPASKWMYKKIAKPTFIQVVRDIDHAHFLESGHDLSRTWINELAFCLRWMDGTVHHIDLKAVQFAEKRIYAFHLFLRFNSGATANIFINATAVGEKHQRFAADNNYLLDCNVLDQTVRLGETNEHNHLFFNRKSFDATKAAELSALEFIKSIQLKRPTIYNGYHLLKLARTIDKVQKRMARL